ncbi:MAG: Kelch repeat-containing protein, partial [Planctomycetota bacterium]
MATHPARRPFPVALAFALALVTITAGACRDTDPNTPISQLSFPTERTGVVAMRYTLLNEDTVSASIEANFAVGNEEFQAATRVPGTEAITGLRASPGGTAHIFSWDALADLGPGTHVVFFQIVPSIGSQVGTVATIGPFSVFNVGIPERLTDLAEPLTGGAGSVSATGGAVLTGGADLAGTVVEITGDALALRTLASLTTPRRDHAQVTGQVAATGEVEPVVFGGRDANGPLASVERYDATADAWSALTDLPDARTGHTATLLGTGQHVLIAGGVDASGLLVTDLVYDLVTGTSIPTTGSSTGAARTGHAATSLPDGRVLVTGGEDAGSTPLDTTLIFRFDKTAGTAIYAQGPALTKPRSRHSAALLGDTLVVIGGETTGSVIDDGVETLDATLGAGAAFEVATVAATGADSAMSTPRAGHAIVALGETEALVLGGSDGTVALDSLERFVLSLGSFVTVPVGLAAERGQPIAVPFGAGHALIAGGGSASVEIFRPLGNGSAGGASPEVGPTAGRTAHAGSLLGDGRVLVTGGASGRFAGGASVPLASAAVFDQLLAGTARLAQAGSMITAREHHAQATLSDGRAVVAGGLGDSATALNSLEAYDPDTDSFSALRAVLPTGRSGLSAATLEDGRVLLIGGDEGA